MSSRLAAFVLFAACACNSNKPVPGEATSAPAASASPQESGAFELPGVLAVEGGTRAVKFRYAVAAKRPYSEALTILVSTHPRSCKDLEGGYSLSQDETVFRFIVAPSLKGKEWGMVETYYASTSSLGGVPSGTPVAQSDPKKPVRLSIDKELRGWGGATLTVKGDVVAEGCGEVAERIVGPAAPGPARPQKDLSFSVGGQQQTVRAALYDTAHERLVL